MRHSKQTVNLDLLQEVNKMLDHRQTKLIMAVPAESQKIFEKHGVEIHYCGIGKVNAAIKTTELILKYRPSVILNLGTAGSSCFAAHSLIECSSFVQRDMDLSPLGVPVGKTPLDDIPGVIESEHLLTDLTKGVCGTGDTFEVGATKISCDLVDMEAYAIAKACKRFNVQFSAFKYITDGSDHDAHKDWMGNLVPAANALFDLYKKLVT